MLPLHNSYMAECVTLVVRGRKFHAVRQPSCDIDYVNITRSAV